MALIFILGLFVTEFRASMLFGVTVALLSFQPDEWLLRYGLFPFVDLRRWLGFPAGWVIGILPALTLVIDIGAAMLGISTNLYQPVYPTFFNCLWFGFGFWFGYKNWCPTSPPK